jgi:formylglycine-generating enzyme required for sulfatase activity
MRISLSLIQAFIALPLILLGVACNSDEAQTEQQVIEQIRRCLPTDPDCALEDTDGDNILNQIDEFPLDPNCSKLSSENCTACGQGCSSGYFCARNIQNGLFVGGVCQLSQIETCNGIDDDGDGNVDNGPPSENQKGVCGGSRKVCGPRGGFIEPNYETIPNYVLGGELCDSLDNDCDGLTDEAPSANRNQGVCQGLKQVCDLSINAFKEPDYTVIDGYSTTEICDGLDNDCNGAEDDDISGEGDLCRAGVGACQEEGVMRCDALAQKLVCTVDGGVPRTESCNGKDDDCDGRTDESLANVGMSCSVGTGACMVEGRTICADETGTIICDAIPSLPTSEACNGLDDDCDGSTDEEAMGVGLGCSVGTGACLRQGIYECDMQTHQLICSQEPSEAVAEICNGVDDDCDGRVDETIPGAGVGCSIGTGLCASSGEFVCNPVAGQLECNAMKKDPAVEECNGVDDDCDGVIDNHALGTNEVCTIGVGACAQESVYRCDSERRMLVCDAQSTLGSNERCNTVDDDCDGVVDEGLLSRIDDKGLEWICVNGGDFMMGWNDGVNFNQLPLHPVTVPTFEMTKSEITVGQYLQCVVDQDCLTINDPNSNWNSFDKSNHPINVVDWDDAMTFAQWANARLPSEAEWEYVARNRGLNQQYAWGSEPANCTRAVMNDPRLGDSCGGGETSQPVCSKPAGNNALGICDLNGNVWEWVMDLYHDNYVGAPRNGAAWLTGPSADRIIRGGSWVSLPTNITSTYRLSYAPTLKHVRLGFRLSRTVSAQD